MGTTLVVADGVELGVPATFGRADTMSQGPPFAPPAVRWTLMQLLSMNSLEGTPSIPARSEKMRSHTPLSAQRRKRCRGSSSARRHVPGSRPTGHRYSAHELSPTALDGHRPEVSRACRRAAAARSETTAHPKTKRNPPSTDPPRRRTLNHIHSAMGIRFMGPDPSVVETLLFKAISAKCFA